MAEQVTPLTKEEAQDRHYRKLVLPWFRFWIYKAQEQGLLPKSRDYNDISIVKPPRVRIDAGDNTKS